MGSKVGTSGLAGFARSATELLRSQAAVRCPYCQEEHIHTDEEGLAHLVEASPSLAPPCLKPDARSYYPPYKLRFPDHSTVDREKWRFVTGTPPLSLEGLAQLTQGCRTGEEIHRDTVLEDLRRRVIQDHFLDACHRGDTDAVKRIASAHRQPCTDARDVLDNTGLIIAAGHGHYETCQTLVSDGFDKGWIHAQNALGRNAFMTA